MYANPAAPDWSAELTKFLAADQTSRYLDYANLMAGDNTHQVGQTLIDSRVTEATADTMKVQSCTDSRAVDILDASGVSVKDPALGIAPALQMATVKLDPTTGHWTVSELINPNPVQRC